MQKKNRYVELLAPAGNMECFYAAIAAGADAVYLGGDRYGARAYADNFTQEEICHTIRYAHVLSRKVYLTVNTMVKERERWELIAWLKPYYDAGLDAVIVQDPGVLLMIREAYPDLDLHASTQMSITTGHGVNMLHALGVCRVVPARELTLVEIRAIAEESKLELECFIHGAMCYAYSGHCLYSSFLGGRSGNRGTCAQSCRLPHTLHMNSETQEIYPLSMKDMCTVNILPELIEAGISSFKIEGRMKSKEYVTGVTSIYRKYIDRYYEQGNYIVEQKDADILNKLYVRSQLSEGYYKEKNRNNLITMVSPSYNDVSEQVLQQLNKGIAYHGSKREVSARITLEAGKEVSLSFMTQDLQHEVVVNGAIVDCAQKKPLMEEDVRKQLVKLGDTPFVMHSVEVILEGQCFLPVAELNRVRREAVARLQSVITQHVREVKESVASIWILDLKDALPIRGLGVRLAKKEHLTSGIIEFADYIEIPVALYQEYVKSGKCHKPVILVLPQIVRGYQRNLWKPYLDIVLQSEIAGVVCSSWDTLALLRDSGYAGLIYADGTLQSYNAAGTKWFQKVGVVPTLSMELHQKEWEDMKRSHPGLSYSINVYGRIAMMVTSQCPYACEQGCQRKTRSELDVFDYLEDRKGVRMPVFRNCELCYSTIYNGVPMSLHRFMSDDILRQASQIRIILTDESGAQAEEVTSYYHRILKDQQSMDEFPVKDTMTGHYRKSVL